MKTIYVKLAEIFVQHEYRLLNQSIDFQLVPTTDCQKIMTRFGWFMRAIPNGYGIFAKSPAAQPNELQYTDAMNLVLRFVVRVQNPNFYHFADLAKTLRIGQNILYFNNIKKPVLADEQGFLENHPLFENPAYNRMPIRLVATPIYRDTLVVAAHVPQTILTIEAQKNDETGSRLLKTFVFDTSDSDSETKIDYFIDLSTIDGFSEGRYELFKTVNTLVKSTESIFYAPDLNEMAPMGLIELWASRGEQPFLGDSIVLPVRYQLRFASKPILLQYVVENTLTKETIASDTPKLQHRIADFDIENYKRVVEKWGDEILSGKVWFTLRNPIKWQDTMKTPILTYQNEEHKKEEYPLPLPEPSIAPQWDPILNQNIVKMFVTF